ncbi:MAG: response regulator [Granulosicoccus sp.]
MSEPTKILLVEDDRNIALALQIRLRASGHDVHLAASVAGALAFVSEHVPIIAVIDINLPDGNGIELVRTFGTLGLPSPISSIVMTASHKPELREKALGAGARVFLEKPFPSSALIEAIASSEQMRQAS